MTQATTTTTTSADARLLALLADTRETEAQHLAACQAEDEPGIEQTQARLDGILEQMAEIRADGWLGVAAKAARICRSLADGHGMALMVADAPLAESLAEDLARLAPEAVA